ncbi:ankyrin repeat-containing domain protein [Clohesyomyces aquaticus]|uniref:Ankyrin repeat-containing domain protein n=1 Tax=Clohesyomyces aquaticus TaxID=1231657 RepID=A0A1Y2A3T7_9PLEO|nr:ankyrin repeat-containing domain protein [Clohesyomyces aquaticus]
MAYLWSRGIFMSGGDTSGQSIIHYGFNGHCRPSMIEFLINAGFEISYCSPIHGNVFHQILTWDYEDLGKIRENLRLINYRAIKEHTPLYLAAAKNLPAATKLLLKHGANIDDVGGPEGTALMVAAKSAPLGAPKTLLAAGASVSLKTEHGLSALDAARYRSEIVRWFLVERFTERLSLAMNYVMDLSFFIISKAIPSFF